VPKVTAAITTYNRAGYVVGAVESVLAQTFRDVETIVVDDGSTDGTAEALAPYEGRITYIRRENAERANARNAALRLATGVYVAFLDSDDTWRPDRLERQVPVLDGCPQASMVHGHIEVIDTRGVALPAETERQRRQFEEAHATAPTYARYARNCLCYTSTILLRRSTLERAGGYDPVCVPLEDLDLYLRLLLNSDIAFLGGAPLAGYRHHPAQSGLAELTAAEIRVCRKHLALLDGGARVAEPRRARCNLALRLAASHHRLADGRGTRRWAFVALRADPRAFLGRGVTRQLALSFVPRRIRLRARGRRRSAVPV
jgi:glycosyltransferase involved in cell wall biosynthesis